MHIIYTHTLHTHKYTNTHQHTQTRGGGWLGGARGGDPQEPNHLEPLLGGDTDLSKNIQSQRNRY